MLLATRTHQLSRIYSTYDNTQSTLPMFPVGPATPNSLPSNTATLSQKCKYQWVKSQELVENKRNIALDMRTARLQD